MASPGISCWLGSAIHSLFHSLCPLGLISINLTPCLSDAAARSAGLGEMFTKAMGHQHFDCGTPNVHYSLCPQWSQQLSVSMISKQWLVPVPEPGKPTWRPVNFVSVICSLLPSLNATVSSVRFFFGVFVFQQAGSPCGLVCRATLFVSAFCARLSTVSFYQSPGTFTYKCMIWTLPPPADHCVHLASLSRRRKKKKVILPSWLLLSWIFFLRWWWTIALWILVLCK